MFQIMKLYKCTDNNQFKSQWANRTQKTIDKWDSKGNRSQNSNHYIAKVFCVMCVLRHS